MLKYVLSVCVICSTISCNTTSWNWEANPYAFDRSLQLITNGNHDVLFTDPEIEVFACFDENNLADLKYNIDKLDLDKKSKTTILNTFKKINKVFEGVNDF